MPGPNVQALIDRLQPRTAPEPTSVLERFKTLPPPEVMGEAISAVGPPEGLYKALAPLSRGSLARGQELAQELAGRFREVVPPAQLRVPVKVRRLADFLEKPIDFNIDPNKIAALDKVTGVKPPLAGKLNIPEGFQLPKQMPMARHPEMDKMTQLWKKIEAVKQPPKQSRPLAGNYGQLSGRWGPRGAKRGHAPDLRRVAKAQEE